MHEAIQLAEIRGGGLIEGRDLAELGLSAGQLARALAAGDIFRVRRGFYARPPTDRFTASTARHRLLVRATNARADVGLVVSHESAAAMHGLPIIGPWPSQVHVMRGGRTGGSSQQLIRAHAVRSEPETELIDGVRVTTLARTLADVASGSSFLVGVTMLDHALRMRAVTRDEVSRQLGAAAPRYGMRGALAAIEFSDGRSGSVGESLSRVRVFQLGFEAPELQVEVKVGSRRFEVDFGWEGIRRFGEFDGAVKYTRSAELSGRRVEDVVTEEKVREDLIREATDRRFTRWLWREALDARHFDRRLTEAGVPRVRRTR